MLLDRAEQLANELLKQHNLTDWNFEFDNARRRFGRCSYRNKKITLSKYLVGLNSEDKVRNTILHEIAHALTDPYVGHGREWVLKCIQLGIAPERCYNDEVETPEHNYEGYCATCDKVVARRIRLKQSAKRLACSTCCNGVYQTEFILEWRKVKHNPAPLVEFIDELP